MKVLRHDLFTNDIVYAEVVFDMGSLKHELLPLVPLFWYVLSSLVIFLVSTKFTRNMHDGNAK